MFRLFLHYSYLSLLSYLSQVFIMADWANLHKDLLELIAKRLYLADYQSFGAVCSSWRSLIIQRRHCKFPWLVLSDDDRGPQTHAFFRLVDNKICRLEVPEIHGKRCCGSSFGWLITASNNSESLHLLNPFSRVQIQLPPPSKFPYPQYTGYPDEPTDLHFLHKAILSSDPASSSDFIVMAVYSETNKLAFFKNGDESWRHVDTSSYSPICVKDIVYHKGQFYALSQFGRVLICHLEGMNPRAIEITPPIKYCCERNYLVELSGELLQVGRFLKYGEDDENIVVKQDKEEEEDGEDNGDGEDNSDGDGRDNGDGDGEDNDDGWDNGDSEDNDDGWLSVPHMTNYFKVLKLEETSEGTQRWVALKSLGEDTLFFLGQNTSFSLSLRDFPSFKGKGNRIYFTDDYYEGSSMCGDLVVCSLEDKSIEPFLPNGIIHLGDTPPIWITPNPS